jgi:hypothetical protein
MEKTTLVFHAIQELMYEPSHVLMRQKFIGVTLMYYTNGLRLAQAEPNESKTFSPTGKGLSVIFLALFWPKSIKIVRYIIENVR